MSRFNNASAFLAVGKRFSLSIHIHLVTDKTIKFEIDDCHSVERLVDWFDEHINTIRATISLNLMPPSDGLHKTDLSAFRRWELLLENLFDYHEYHYVERFAAIARLVHMLNEQ